MTEMGFDVSDSWTVNPQDGLGVTSDIQQGVIDATEEYGAENIMIVLGTPGDGKTAAFATTFISGDPLMTGPLTGVALNLDVRHIVELKNEEWMDSAVYEENIDESLLNIEGVISDMSSARET